MVQQIISVGTTFNETFNNVTTIERHGEKIVLILNFFQKSKVKVKSMKMRERERKRRIREKQEIPLLISVFFSRKILNSNKIYSQTSI